LLYRIFALITILPVLIKWHTLPGLLDRLTPANEKGSATPGTNWTEKKIITYTDFILGWGFGVWKQTCLKRSLVLFHFLRKIGMPIQICFGIRLPSVDEKNDQGHLEGHAWLRYREDIFLEVDPEMTVSFTETYRYPKPQESTRYAWQFGPVTQ